MESRFQSIQPPRERLASVKGTATLMTPAVAVYAQLQREIHYALRAQHPEWILPNGDSPTCDSYDARFAELLMQLPSSGSRPLKQENIYQCRYEHPARLSTSHNIR